MCSAAKGLANTLRVLNRKAKLRTECLYIETAWERCQTEKCLVQLKVKVYAWLLSLNAAK